MLAAQGERRPVHRLMRRGSRSGRTVAMTESIRFFEDLDVHSVEIAGGKGANLGELTRAGLPVPPGFVITAPAYLAAMDDGGVRDQLRTEAAVLDPDDVTALDLAAEHLQELVHKAGVSDRLRADILAAYHRLGDGVDVAVRSSATAEDTAGTSFAGMNETYTHVRGDDDLIAHVRDCWASLFGARVLSYRASQRIEDEPAIAVVVQKMAPAERSGVMFTTDPTTGDKTHLVIEGAFGLGEVVVGGQVEPDTYVVDTSGPRLLSTRVGHQAFKLVAGPDGGNLRVDLPPEESTARVLTDEEAIALARVGIRIAEHYGCPQDVEWVLSGDDMYIVQSRPITTLGPAAAAPRVPVALVSGLPAAPGVVAGRVRLITSPKDGGQLKAGEILVAPMTNPDWVPTIRRAAALVTDGGGMTCHAAIVARELRLPCIVGTRDATKVLRDGELVTVDGAAGKVLEGDVVPVPAATTASVTTGGPAARQPEPSARSCTSTSPSRPTRSRWPRSPWTASACCARSSWSPTRSAGCTRASSWRAARAAASSRRWPSPSCRSPAPSCRGPSSTAASTSGPTSSGGSRAVTSTSRSRATR
jgi:pyruvate,water dikinase